MDNSRRYHSDVSHYLEPVWRSIQILGPASINQVSKFTGIDVSIVGLVFDQLNARSMISCRDIGRCGMRDFRKEYFTTMDRYELLPLSSDELSESMLSVATPSNQKCIEYKYPENSSQKDGLSEEVKNIKLKISFFSILSELAGSWVVHLLIFVILLKLIGK